MSSHVFAKDSYAEQLEEMREACKHRLPSIQDIELMTKEKSPYFFSKDTLRFFGQTKSKFKVFRGDGKIFIACQIKDSSGKMMGWTLREFTGTDLIEVEKK